jgi:hypothetical protein
MINFNEQLTQEQALFVLNEVFPIFTHRIAHSTLSKIAEGHNLVFKEQVGVPGCSCEYRAQHQLWVSRLEQYKSQIEAVAYPPIVEQTTIATKRKKKE